MKEIKIYFVDFSSNFVLEDNFYIDFLSKYYDVIIDANPDYLFYSCFGSEHYKFKHCIKIFYTGENLVPDFNLCDYAMGFHHLQFGDRYLRFPLYLQYSWDKLEALQVNKDLGPDMAKRLFCNFVYSNSKWADPYREKFFWELSKYKKVDSGGRYLNNVGGSVANKLDFIKDYKFTIAIENSMTSGYTTEKLVEPMLMNSLPIYYGDPAVASDFNPNAFVNLRDYKSMKEAIEYIVYLDQDDNSYLKILNSPCFSIESMKNVYENRLLTFLQNIFDRPYSDVKRLSIFGYAALYMRDMQRVSNFPRKIWFQKLCGLKDRLSK